jgi:hypothetical protein
MTDSKSVNVVADAEDSLLLVFQVSDEALESAARRNGTGPEFTMAACTGLSNCPGP